MFLAFDTETTGANFIQHQVIQVGAILCDENLKEIARKEWNINYHSWNRYWDEDAENVHGISEDNAAKHGLDPDDFCKQFQSWMMQNTGIRDPKWMEKNVYLVGANCQFDYNFFKYSLWDDCMYVPDELPFSYRMLYDTNALGNFVVGKNSLGALCKHFGIPQDNSKRHSALYDAELHLEVFRSILLADIARCNGQVS